MSDSSFDVIVVGCGVIGSATAHAIASSGLSVAVIDRYSPPHNMGSSHGHTRAIRRAYFEQPEYVPLLVEAYELWRKLESDTRTELMNLCGVLEVGPPDGELISGVRQSALTHELPVDNLTSQDVQKRFPGFRMPTEFDLSLIHISEPTDKRQSRMPSSA